MKKVVIFILMGALAAGLALAAARFLNEKEAAPLLKPLKDINAAATEKTAATTPVLDDLTRTNIRNQFMKTDFNLLPLPSPIDLGWNDQPATLPQGFKHIISIEFSGRHSLIRAYAAPVCALNQNTLGDCLGDRLIIYKYNIDTQKSESIGELKSFAGANYGGIYVPLALTKDDQNIILRAAMGSPGAGGGAVNLGYSFISAVPGIYATSSKQLPRLASAEAIFYDRYGKMISLEEGNQTPDWSQPGRNPNQGMLLAQDLLTGKKTVLAAAPDTYYEIAGFDESRRSMRIQAVYNAYTATCPRATEALDCSTKTATMADLPLP